MSGRPAPEIPALGSEPAQLLLARSIDSKSEVSDEKLPKEKGKAVLISSIKKDEPVVNRKELWSYYLYLNGDNGAAPIGYCMTLFQKLAFSAGYDPVAGPGSPCDADDASGQCVLPWGNGTKAVSSVVLVANGVSFAVMTAIFTTIGSAADYGTFGRWLLLVTTVICWSAQFAMMSLTSPDRWGAAMGLYMVTFISWGATTVFIAAVFPGLARNTPHARQLRIKYEEGEVENEIYEKEESLEKNRISNISMAHANMGYLVVLCLNLSLLLPLAENAKVDNYVIVLTNSYGVLAGIWWFIFQQPRPGPPLPTGAHYLTIGWKQIWAALKTYKKLPYTFIYLISYFLLADGLNTTTTLVSVIQNDKLGFSFLLNTYINLVQAATSVLSSFGFWYIQRYWKISTKKMFAVTNIFSIIIPLWGMIGIWTDKFGYHNAWEFWVYNAIFGIFQAPYFAFSQTMMAELTPPGFDNMFFGLFGLSNRASSMVGPNVVQAIIDKTGNNWQGFPFLFALCCAASVVIWFGVDVEKGRRDAIGWADEIRNNSSASSSHPVEKIE